MQVEQFVMAYQIEQDRIRAMLPEGFESLRPVLRINTEIRDESTVYIEFNTPVASKGMRGWLNIAHWSSVEAEIAWRRDGKKTTITAPFLHLEYKGVGAAGGCPAEKDNDGCWFLDTGTFQAAERIDQNKEFCDCSFNWSFHPGDSCGKSMGRTLPAYQEDMTTQYERQALTAEAAAAIPCLQVLGCYIVRFER